MRALGCVVLAVLIAVMPLRPAAAQGVPLIRDAEIETYLHDLAAPIFRVAGIPPDSVRIYIVNDPSLNAFVAGGMNMFFHTGLLMRTQQPGQLLGVIAHETGHIAGGHLARSGEASTRAAAEMILAAILGVAAGVATGSGDVTGAILAGGQTYALTNLARYSRSQEQAADHAGVSYLDELGLSSEGLANFLQILEDDNILRTQPPPYLMSHPLTRDRVAFVRRHADDPNSPKGEVGKELLEEHARMRAKLVGFMQAPASVLASTPDDGSLPNRYARTIALYRKPDLPSALASVDQLIAQRPDDAFFHELKGQMLFENGRVAQAEQPYVDALRLHPDEALFQLALGQIRNELGQPDDLRRAVGNLREAVRLEPQNPTAWRTLGIALGRQGDTTEADLALAESALLVRRIGDAELYMRRAERSVQTGDRNWLHLQDLQRDLADAKADQQENPDHYRER
ncbi:M48 family metalloprotease [Marinivivus vitaminiproducens]|uniref:M48 family metalloprotease n=1 Tax=Marinivivus vitaminiproducens TaxID=3035935 RepID=UPI00279A6254|nr:M48 family metalloprotease [Geminicoccaceae bacterium SCSIO 64248]